MLMEVFRAMADRGPIDDQQKEWDDLMAQTKTTVIDYNEAEAESDYGGSGSD
jgi:hypothetical protein